MLIYIEICAVNGSFMLTSGAKIFLHIYCQERKTLAPFRFFSISHILQSNGIFICLLSYLTVNFWKEGLDLIHLC